MSHGLTAFVDSLSTKGLDRRPGQWQDDSSERDGSYAQAFWYPDGRREFLKDEMNPQRVYGSDRH